MCSRALPAVAALAALVGSAPAYAQADDVNVEEWHHMWEWGAGHMMFGSLMMLVIWGLIILFVVLAVRWMLNSSSGLSAAPSSNESPLDILRKRFAQGDIDEHEFEKRKKLLSE